MERNFGHERRRKVDGEETCEWKWRVPPHKPPGYRLEDRSEWKLGNDGVRVLTKRYTHPSRNKEITVNFIAGCAVTAFPLLPFHEITVFVNRGDNRGTGEGSSGICWLSDDGIPEFPNGFLSNIISRITPGGFIVSDGSNADKLLAEYWSTRDEVPINVHNTIKPIELHGRTLKCVGSMKPQYGPVLVWQMIG